MVAPYVFRMDNIRFWVGSGTNKCAVVVDFNDGGTGDRSFAWGFRWNGAAPSVKAILDEITASDPRLKMFASSSEYGSFIDAFAYDVDGDGGTFKRVWNNDTYAYYHVKSDDDDLFPDLESTSYIDEQTENYVYEGTSWMLLFGTGETFADVAFAETPNGAPPWSLRTSSAWTISDSGLAVARTSAPWWLTSTTARPATGRSRGAFAGTARHQV